MLPVLSERSLRREDVDAAQWNDWRWQLRNMLRTAEDFSQIVPLSDDERAGLKRTQDLFRTGATPY